MKFFSLKKISYFTIIIIFLMITDFGGLVLISNAQKKLNDLQTIFLWQESLRKENVSPTIANEVSQIETVFPNEQEIIQLASNLNQFKGQFETFSLTFESEEVKGTNLKYLPFLLEITGNDKKIVEFLSKLWKAPYVFEVTSLEMKKEPKINQTALMLRMNLYVQNSYGE